MAAPRPRRGEPRRGLTRRVMVTAGTPTRSRPQSDRARPAQGARLHGLGDVLKRPAAREAALRPATTSWPRTPPTQATAATAASHHRDERATSNSAVPLAPGAGARPGRAEPRGGRVEARASRLAGMTELSPLVTESLTIPGRRSLQPAQLSEARRRSGTDGAAGRNGQTASSPPGWTAATARYLYDLNTPNLMYGADRPDGATNETTNDHDRREARVPHHRDAGGGRGGSDRHPTGLDRGAGGRRTARPGELGRRRAGKGEGACAKRPRVVERPGQGLRPRRTWSREHLLRHGRHRAPRGPPTVRTRSAAGRPCPPGVLRTGQR